MATLAGIDAVEASFLLSEVFAQVCSTAESLVYLSLNCYIDSKQLYKTICSFHPLLDNRFRVAMEYFAKF